MPNRLVNATSPYLLQHADNPVDWQEWGDAAFAEAVARDVPVLVSVGYAACHWCHVMAHESFEDPGVAAFLNEHFVCVKVDREERPDVDAVYMAATQAMTGSGGWPMTVFTTPSGEPFFCGTYFPPRRVQQMASFSEVLAAVAAAWSARREEVLSTAGAVVEALAGRPAAGRASERSDDELVEAALAGIATTFDAARGGFGGAPKFPPSMVLEWLLRHHARTGDPGALDMAVRTLDAMARGGMYDQLAGGFARYAVDPTWTVPHFEKMLYDNALLLRVYAHAWRTTDAPLTRRVASETATWMVEELATPEGGFASSLDADSEGREGAFYAWTPEQLRDVLGAEDGAWAAGMFGVTEDGTFEHGTSVLQRRGDPGDEARLARRARAAPRGARTAAAARSGRQGGDRVERPGRRGPRGVGRAARPSRAPRRGRPGGRARSSRRTSGGPPTARPGWSARRATASPGDAPGVLEDYGNLAEGLLTLSAVTGDARWFEVAGRLLDTVLRPLRRAGRRVPRHRAGRDGRRRRPPRPAAGPGRRPDALGPVRAAGALLTYAALTGSAPAPGGAPSRRCAVRWSLAIRYPRAAGAALAVVEAALDGPREVAVVGPGDDPRTAALHRCRDAVDRTGLVVAVGEPGGRERRPGAPARPAARRRSAGRLRVPGVRVRPAHDPPGGPRAAALRRCGTSGAVSSTA